MNAIENKHQECIDKSRQIKEVELCDLSLTITPEHIEINTKCKRFTDNNKWIMLALICLG